MELLIRAHSGEWREVSAAVVDFDPGVLLSIMDNWPRFADDLSPSSLYFVDDSSWFEGGDIDAIDVLDNGPMIEFGEIELGVESRVECQAMVVGRDYVYWQGVVRHTDVRCETDMLHRDDIEGHMSAVDRLGEAVADGL